MTKKLRNLLFLLILLFALFGIGSKKAYAATESVKVNVTFQQTECRKQLDWLNKFRTGSDAWYWNSDNKTKTVLTNLGTVTWDYELEKLAMQRAAEVALYYSHTRTNNTKWLTVYEESGVSYVSAAENIAAGYTSSSSVFAGWQEADKSYEGQGHRRNMLSPGFNRFAAAGVYYNGVYYWVQAFAKKTTGSAAFTANNAGTNMTCRINTSLINDVVMESSYSEAALAVGESVSLPKVSTRLQMQSYWNNRYTHGPVTPTYQLSVDNPAIAAIENGKLVGKAAGTTNLKIKALGKTISVKVKCTASPIDEHDVAYIFSDVSSDSWFHDAVQYVYDNGIMTGMTSSTFGPSVKVSRSQFTTILYRLAGNPAVTYKPIFQDIPSGTWYSDAVIWASDAGIVTGYTQGEKAGCFGPSDTVTREQMALMLFRFANYKGMNTDARASLAGFEDYSSVSAFARDAMEWAVGTGLIGGKTATILDPAGTASRAECATIIMRFMKL